MADQHDAKYKSGLFSQILRQREDRALQKIIEDFDDVLRFKPIEELMISEAAWAHVEAQGMVPELVFAHPDLLESHPETSQYYRGMGLLSQKQVGQLSVNVSGWEDGSRKGKVPHASCLKVARLYNTVICSIMEGSTDWTLENGYRNIVAMMGIRLDGMFRNKIGQMAEELVKGRIAQWLKRKGLIESSGEGWYELADGYTMRYGSEPDISFLKNGQVLATIETKGGKDPAGALERLGAVQKSFAETPPGCTNMLIAGGVTDEMQTRLDQMGVTKVFYLDDVASEGAKWDAFVHELFHHTIRIA
ncbi:MAG: XcyI family restriction endonuclease [Gammaproteobacteria bacterium]|nr:XcyI family restriction endonuclease [Gammaproteobacteria bacterium]MDE0272719.1 XcyI family restriction endonuclease [Gammaproteobacteria bacterium]